VSLGELWANHRPCHIGVNPILLQDVPNFTICQSHQVTPLLLYGSDDGFIAVRFHLQDSMLDLLSQLSAAIDTLLPIKLQRAKVKCLRDVPLWALVSFYATCKTDG